MRVAMMRSLYFEEEKTESDFWVEMDKLLAHIRTEAKGDKLSGVAWFIDEDMKKYGIQEGEDLVEERELDEEAPAWFEEVNKVVAGDGKRT
ncbi:hypothetical protein A0H81_01414 [Grifola frondosa]|uniref:Uncharacterized protein n=1 Tax=Grifola frondosa TaxID=5627 RepID=A0A1C7MTH2_GRIFR|nr:hypothetical protein A0H81_01414 [Grifola frondosa]